MNVKILVLGNGFEAELITSILKENGIPHLIRTYHDSAYDGLWQTSTAWGEVDAPEEYREKIMSIYEEMKASGGLTDEEAE